VEAQTAAAKLYFEDGSIEDACPPLRALLHIMAHGQYEGKDVSDPEIRALFTREALLASDWYKARLLMKQKREVALWTRHVAELERFLNRPGYQNEAARLNIAPRLEAARHELERVAGAAYLEELHGGLGADPIRLQNAPRVQPSGAAGEAPQVFN
jgi:hypothetical protein